MSDFVQNPSKALALRTRRFPPPPDGCPITALIARGRKGEARDQQLSVAEEVAKGTKRRVATGIYRRRG